VRDGDIDYSRYTLLELEEALAGINKQQYPRNHANLCSSYERLKKSPGEAFQPTPTVTVNDAAARKPGANLWKEFWGSRSIRAVMGAIFFGYAYYLFTQPDSCPSGRRFFSMIIKTVCENLGHEVAAGIPFTLGVILITFAIIPKRSGGA
jgi:hypothetical protein